MTSYLDRPYEHGGSCLQGDDCGKEVLVLDERQDGALYLKGDGETGTAQPKEFSMSNRLPISYDDHLQSGDALKVIDNLGAQGQLDEGAVYHFSRWMNGSTLMTEEHEGSMGKIGFYPWRFVRA